ncbi:D-alanyl-D-alanine carboxypeptidase-like protein [Pseudonocardia sediminis]|uniref:D-alanyl-D-alanine carboxypeptidase-like protein n=1 Tax=Pseudonocardia sediminis TaxID=1397368 RepID=A0A4Q7V1T6_PSEST|nr:M15 family metallopeptidase [Pseudonocardia sediminis]RZT87434.1 D-alanyl-D-alanine carboxypeptidase-like protein [Pseudonocardia sediminis]
MAIDLTDYSKTAAQRGWGAGWPSCNGAKAAGTATVSADLSGVRVSVHKRIARLVDLLMDATEKRGYRLKSGHCGGYNCRAISGTNSPSNHSWGLAVDLNWQSNPYVRPRRTDMPVWMPLLWNRYGFAWGGNYGSNGTRGKADAMHYEFMGSPADADAMTALALRELAGGSAPASATPPVSAPAIPEDIEVLDNTPLAAGRNDFRLIVPTGSASQLIARSWVSIVGNGANVTGTIYAQSDTGGLKNFPVSASFANGHSQRWWTELPSGTTQIGIVLDAPRGGTLALEAKAK